MKFILVFCLFFVLSIATLCVPALCSDAIILNESFDGSSEAFRFELIKELRNIGFNIIYTNALEVESALLSSQESGKLFVLTDSRYFPIKAKSALDEFLKRGNNLLAISGPSFVNMLFWADNKWLNREQAKSTLSALSGFKLVDFAIEDIKKWHRYPEDGIDNVEITIEDTDEPNIPKSLHYKIKDYQSSDMFVSQDLLRGFSENCKALVFWARGGFYTSQLKIELQEQDGSRWMKVFDIKPSWKQYVFIASDFTFWGGNANRGKEGDKLNPGF